MSKDSKPQIEEYLVSFIDSMYDGVLIVDRDERVLYVNDSFTRVTGAEKKDLLGRILHTVRPGARMPEVIGSGVPQLGIHRVVGNREHVANVFPIFKDGKVIGGASISNDTSDIMRISKELETYRQSLDKIESWMKTVKLTRYSFDDIIAVDKESVETKNTAIRLALRDISVLVTGESGTGKEVYAQAIHNASNRRSSPFVAINCSAMSPSLLESELFGYADGAFTGAKKGGKPGVFEAADKGTVFLDEIGEMDIVFQAKLLRTLQEGVVRPVGSNEERRVDVRVLSATNRDLPQMVAENRFRLDLFYRIAPITLALAPLRERPGDLEALIGRFLEQEGKQNHKNLKLSQNAYDVLMSYPWPGNIRELGNVLCAAAVLVEKDTIDVGDFPKAVQDYSIEADYVQLRSLKDVVRKAESDLIRKALLRYGDTTEGKRNAARALGISVATLYNKLAKP